MNGTLATTRTAGNIGLAPEPAYGADTSLEGSIDELRLSTVARSHEWISTEFNNQSSPATFYAVGPEQPVP